MNPPAAPIVLVLALGLASAPLSAATVSLTDPGLFEPGSLADAFTAQVRVDANATGWKNALFDGSESWTGPASANPFQSGEPLAFTLSIDAQTGAVLFDLAGLSVGADLDFADGAALAGFRLEARSGRNHGSAELADLLWNLDGRDAIAPGLVSGDRDQTVVSDTYYFDHAATNATLSGSVRFTWDDPANTRGDRFGVSLVPLLGLPTGGGEPIVPAPGALAVLTLGLSMGRLTRRKRG